MFTRKSQAEIAGIAIVAVIMLAALMFVMFSGSEQPNSSFDDKRLASSAVSTLISTSVPECKQLATMMDLYKDCAEQENNCNDLDQTSFCKKAEQLTEELLKQTLGEWQKAYTFSLSTSGNTIFAKENRCKAFTRKESQEYAIMTKKSPVVIKLEICS